MKPYIELTIHWDRLLCEIIGHRFGPDDIMRRDGIECERCGLSKHRSSEGQLLAWHYEGDV